MIKQLYSIFDELKNDFSGIYDFENHEVAKRWFRQILDGTVLPRDRKDLSLYFLGTFNVVNGEILPHKERIINGGDFSND